MVSFSSERATVSYVPKFLAKTESALLPLPRSFLVRSLSDFAMGLNEDLLYLVHCLQEYVKQTSGVVNRPRCLFVSPRNPSWAMSKNAISHFLREVISESGASKEPGVVPRALNCLS